MTELTTEAIKFVQEHPHIKSQIAEACNCSDYSVRRWLKQNHVMLTTYDCIQVIKRTSKLKLSQIVQDKKTI